MINPNWAKWIQRSVLKNFVTTLAPHKVFAESDNTPKNKLDHWYEVRVDITYTHLQRNNYRANVSVDILVMSSKTNNIYNAKVLSGLAASGFEDITVYNDADTYKFCLKLVGEVIDTYYGEVKNQEQMEQATVEGSFEAFILE